MSLSQLLPQTVDETADLILSLEGSGINIDVAKNFAIFLYENHTNRKFISAIEGYKERDTDARKRFFKKSVTREHINALETGKAIDITKCVRAYLARKFYASGKETGVSSYRAAMASARSFSGGIRSKLWRFTTSTRTQNLLKEHQDVNPESLEYLVLTGKFTSVNEDYEIFSNFLRIMKRDPKTTKS